MPRPSQHPGRARFASLSCLLVAGFISADGRAVGEDLYLLAATPSPKGNIRQGSYLYVVDSVYGSMAKVKDIGGEGAGIEFVEADFGRRTIVVSWPLISPTRFGIVSMDSPSTVREITLEVPRDSSQVYQYLLDVPGAGLYHAFSTPPKACNAPFL